MSVSPALAAASTPSLGIFTVNVRHSAEELAAQLRAVRRERYQLREIARRAVRGHRISICQRQIAYVFDHATVNLHAETGRASYGQVVQCGSVWDCPCCSAKISERRRGDLETGISNWRDRGGRVVMTTHTVSHSRFNQVKDVRERMISAFRRLQRQRGYGSWRRSWLAGFIRSLEVTYSELNGYHPHLHILWFVLPDFDGDLPDMFNQLGEFWVSGAGAEGLVSLYDRETGGPGYHWTETEGEIGDYIAKYGQPEGRDPSPRWGPGAEMTKWQAKHGRETSYSPFDLLRQYAATGQRKWARRFAAFSSGFYRARQLQPSRGIWVALGVAGGNESDAEVAQREENTLPLLRIAPDEFRALVASPSALVTLLDHVEQCPDAPRLVLALLLDDIGYKQVWDGPMGAGLLRRVVRDGPAPSDRAPVGPAFVRLRCESDSCIGRPLILAELGWRDLGETCPNCGSTNMSQLRSA